jgi:transketolase
VVDMHTLKPLDIACIQAVASRGPIVTVEEHSVIGGLGGAVAEALADLGHPAPLRRHGVADEYVPVGPPAALYAHYRLDGPGVAGVVHEFLESLV